MSDKFQIIVTGELMEGAYLPDVKAKLSALFNTPAEKLDPLFSGRRVVIKKGLDEAASRNYVVAVQGAGLRCIAEAITTEPQPAPAAAEPDAGISVAPVGVTLVEAPKVETPQIDTSAYSVAPTGATMDESPPPAAPEIDTSQLDVAPTGENLVEYTPPPPPAIDTDTLSVAPPGETLVEAETVEPPVIDLGDLDLAPTGSDMGEMERGEGSPPPDTSHLKLD